MNDVGMINKDDMNLTESQPNSNDDQALISSPGVGFMTAALGHAGSDTEELKEFITFTNIKRKHVNFNTGDVVDEERGEQLFFKCGKYRVDFVLVWQSKNGSNGTKEEVRDIFEKNLIEEGLLIERDIDERDTEERDIEDGHRRRPQQYTKIHAPFEVLCRYAAIVKIRMPIKERPLKPKTRSLWEMMTSCLSCFVHPFEPDDNQVPALPKMFTHVYDNQKDYLFDIPEDKDNFFSHATRSFIVDYILRRNKYCVRKDEVFNFGIKRLLADGTYSAAYPLHEGSWSSTKMSMRHLLYSHWASWRSWFKMQPLDYIRTYYGEKIGFYFAWLGYYTYWLIPASFVGFFAFIYGFLTVKNDIIAREGCDPDNNFTMCPMCNYRCGYWSYHEICFHLELTHIFDNEFTFFFAIFMSLWGTFYLEFWKREQASIKFQWNLTSFEEEEEPPRPEYLSRLAASHYIKTSSITGKEEPFLPFWRRQVPIYCVSAVSLLFLCLCAIGVIIGIVFYRMAMLAAIYLTNNPLLYDNAVIVVSVTAAMINLVSIFIISFIYSRIAVILTDWECQRTQSDYDNSLAFKLYILQFVNYYSSLFYIAFFKGRFIGSPAHYQTLGKARQEECQGGCLTELCIQLGVIFVGKQLIQNNLMEIFLPRIKAWLKKRCSQCQKAGVASPRTPWEQDFLLEEMDQMGIFNEYLEMMIQFGFVTLFVAAFPLAPFCALLNNIIEIRADSNKLVTQYRRPVAARAESIGIWYDVLYGLSRLAIITNALIIAFTSRFIDRLVYKTYYSSNGTLEGFVNNSLSYFDVSDFEPGTSPRDSVIRPEYNSTTVCRYLDYRHPPWSDSKYTYTSQYWHTVAAQFIFVVCFENCVIAVTNLIAYLIPDMPRKLSDQIRREAYLTNEIILKTELDRAKGGSGIMSEQQRADIRDGALAIFQSNGASKDDAVSIHDIMHDESRV